MARDPAFLFYDGDAARDVSHMNRLERGCYLDLLQAQRKFGGYTVEQARKILGRDFEECWPALELILTKSEGDIYHIEWVTESTEKRRKNAETQRNRIQKYWDEKRENDKYRGITDVIPFENEIERILVLVRENVNIENKVEDKFVAMIVLKMVEIFKVANPKYPVDEKFDYSACLELAYKIAALKKWKKHDVVNGKMNECLSSWKNIVDFVQKDEWLSTRSLHDLNSTKEWQRLVQKMSKMGRPKPEEKTAPTLTKLSPQ